VAGIVGITLVAIYDLHYRLPGVLSDRAFHSSIVLALSASQSR
jgi:hypothetical protein